MELRQTEESIAELVQQYKSVCSRPLAIQQNNNNNNNNNISCEHNVKPPLPKWDDSLLSTSPERTKDHNVDTPNTTSNISVRDLYKVLIHIRDCLVVIDPKIKKIRSRLDMKDPITNAPRYGKKTIEKVNQLTKLYHALNDGIHVSLPSTYLTSSSTTTGEDDHTNNNKMSIVEILEQYIENEKKFMKQMKEEENSIKLKEELERKEIEKEIELKERKQQEEEKRKKELEREELARHAEEARLQRIENEQRVIQAELEADRIFLSSIETGIEGVKKQIQALRGNCSKGEFDIAIKSLHAIFKQISSRPEEIMFRRIRLDHPQFMDDIGKHCGGKELLVAAGFTFRIIDGKKCLFSSEPDLMTDMDSWSSWFDLIKTTFQQLEETIN